MVVFIEKEQRTVETEHSGTAKDLLAGLGINPDVVLIVKDGTLVTPDDSLAGAKKVELLSVISGG